MSEETCFTYTGARFLFVVIVLEWQRTIRF